jgi:hypothetical protein
MFGLPKSIKLEKLWSGEEVTASIIKLGRDLARTHIDDRWWNEPWMKGGLRRSAEDYRWRWRKLVGKFQSKWYVQCIAVQTIDEEIQGAIIFDPNRKSLLNPDEGSVYVEFLAAAPRNRMNLAPRPLYCGAGGGLLVATMIYSRKIGFGGSLTLESLPGSFGWYKEKYNFVETDVKRGSTVLLELPPEHAEERLERLHEQGVF